MELGFRSFSDQQMGDGCRFLLLIFLGPMVHIYIYICTLQQPTITHPTTLVGEMVQFPGGYLYTDYTRILSDVLESMVFLKDLLNLPALNEKPPQTCFNLSLLLHLPRLNKHASHAHGNLRGPQPHKMPQFFQEIAGLNHHSLHFLGP